MPFTRPSVKDTRERCQTKVGISNDHKWSHNLITYKLPNQQTESFKILVLKGGKRPLDERKMIKEECTTNTTPRTGLLYCARLTRKPGTGTSPHAKCENFYIIINIHRNQSYVIRITKTRERKSPLSHILTGPRSNMASWDSNEIEIGPNGH